MTNADMVVVSPVQRSLWFNFLTLGTLPLPNGTDNLVLGNKTSSVEGDKAHDESMKVKLEQRKCRRGEKGGQD